MLLLACLTALPRIHAAAEIGTGPTRETTVTSVYTEYIWDLYTRGSTQRICEVAISHEGYPTQLEMLSVCQQFLLPTTATPTPTAYPAPTPTGTYTPDPTSTPTPYIEPTEIDITPYIEDTYWVFVSSKEVKKNEKISLPEMIMDIEAPSKWVSEPYVTIKAYDPAPGYEITSIKGILAGKSFTCKSSACNIYLEQDSQILYWATSSFGDETPHYSATIRISQNSAAYNVSITNRSQYFQYSGAIARAWNGIAVGGEPEWGYLPQNPSQLATAKNLHYLAAKLIVSGIVNSQDCPGGGLTSDWAPNACGLEKARQAMIDWQNQFDPMIWTASKQYEVPAKLIKSIIEQESQFWPQNGQNQLFDEYGLAQINEYGADTALRWDQQLHDQVCSTTLFDCADYYASMPSYAQAMLRGRLLQLVDVNCPTCAYGFDLTKAGDSIDIIAQTLYANARQAAYVVEKYNQQVLYDDMWKFTIVSYHSGYQCLEEAVRRTHEEGQALNWNNVSYHLRCSGSREYVDNIWQKIAEFETYYPTVNAENEEVRFPTAVAIRPTPTNQPGMRDGILHIYMYIDLNHDNQINDNERVSNETVQVKFEDGEVLTGQVQDGELILKFKNKPIGASITITAPNLYQSFVQSIDNGDEILVVFQLESPELPPVLP